MTTLGVMLHNEITEIWHIYFRWSRTWCASINRAWWSLQPVKVLHSVYAKSLDPKRHKEVLKEPVKIKKRYKIWGVSCWSVRLYWKTHAVIRICQLYCSLNDSPNTWVKEQTPQGDQKFLLLGQRWPMTGEEMLFLGNSIPHECLTESN